MDEKYKEEIEKILRDAEGVDELYSQLDQVGKAVGKIAEVASNLALDVLNELTPMIEHLKPLTFEEALKLTTVFAWVMKKAEEDSNLAEGFLIIFSMGRAYEKYLEIHGKSP